MDAIVLLKAERPDLLLLDIDMPNGRGPEVYTECRRWSPDTRVLVFSGVADPSLLYRMYRLGAEGVLKKDSPPDVVLDAVQSVRAGRRYLQADIKARAEELESRPSLSKRELETLDLIADGLSNRLIAERLGVSIKTVDTHRTNLMTKLDSNSAPQLVVKAMRMGLLSPGSDRV